MKKRSLFIYTFQSLGIWLLSPGTMNVVLAQDAPNVNVTKRRPDLPANYSPSPITVEVDPSINPNIPEVQQVENKSTSSFLDLWVKIRSFFTNLFK